MILRASKNGSRPYTKVDNGIIEDTNVSFRAKGIMLYILSKPDNWQIYLSNIANAGTEGREAVRTALNELRQAGYIGRQVKHTNTGKFSGYEYEVYEIPYL